MTDLAVITFNDVPAVNHSLKYEVLGPMAIDNRRRYCERHGYTFISEVPIERDRPACWAKIPALLTALETHRWALWADSDVLVVNREQRADRFCDDAYDLVMQSHEAFFRFIGVPLAEGLTRMPINTGVFLIQATQWSCDFLRRAYDETQFVTQGEVWDGVGEQEAMTALLRRNPADRCRIKYVTGLQNHPRFREPGDLSLHFYGNYARHRIAAAECDDVIARWAAADRCGEPFPDDAPRFHWCCIQNKTPDAPVETGDLERYLYRPGDIAP